MTSHQRIAEHRVQCFEPYSPKEAGASSLLSYLSAVCFACVLAGCATQPQIKPSEGHIQRESVSAKAELPPPAPVKALPYVPPPQTTSPEPTYTVVVNDVPVKELLFSIARDTKRNIDINPGITGTISLNAVNEPLNAILDRISRQAGLRFVDRGDTISIMLDTPYLKTYRVDYVNLSRKMSSSIGVASQISSTTNSLTGVGTGTSNNSGNSSSTDVTTNSNNDFWGVLKDNIANILYSTKVEQKKAAERAELAETNRLMIEAAQSSKSGSSGSAAPQPSALKQVTSQPGDSEREVIVNPIAGTVSVFANQRQQLLIQEYLEKVTSAAQRQVMIEATIVEVSLKDQYHAGINWQSLASNLATGWTVNTVGAGLGSSNLANQLQPFYAISYTNTGKWDFQGTINLLESFGKTKVLSSPKLMTLNNQTALLKVVDNLVYFTLRADTNQNTNNTTTTFTSTPQTVPVGVVMSVTPQIGSDGEVTLTVRPTITRKVGEVTDPNPDLANAKVTSSIPVIQVREMESLLQVRSGQTVILGGLIQDDSDNARDGLPVLSRPSGIGALFGQHEHINNQTELVIFLRPTIVTDGVMANNDIQRFERLLPPETTSTP